MCPLLSEISYSAAPSWCKVFTIPANSSPEILSTTPNFVGWLSICNLNAASESVRVHSDVVLSFESVVSDINTNSMGLFRWTPLVY